MEQTSHSISCRVGGASSPGSSLPALSPPPPRKALSEVPTTLLSLEPATQDLLWAMQRLKPPSRPEGVDSKALKFKEQLEEGL